jgi:hypothetical protein
MPDVTATFQQALSNADLPFDPERTRAYAFGENCLDPGGNVQHFAAMETDFVVTQAPHDPGDRVELGNYAGAVLRLILSDFGPGSVPGPQEGNVDFVFVTGGEEIRGRVLLADAGSVLASGLEGAELYTALFP